MRQRAGAEGEQAPAPRSVGERAQPGERVAVARGVEAAQDTDTRAERSVRHTTGRPTEKEGCLLGWRRRCSVMERPGRCDLCEE
jgi:hypothetical protein